MKLWGERVQKRLLQLACFGCAAGLPGYLVATDQAKDVSPSIVTLVALFLTCAGLLTSPARTPSRRPKDIRSDDEDDDTPAAPIDPLVRKVRKLVREHMDGPAPDQRMATVW